MLQIVCLSHYLSVCDVLLFSVFCFEELGEVFERDALVLEFHHFLECCGELVFTLRSTKAFIWLRSLSISLA